VINGKMLEELPRIMSRHGVGKLDFIYVADSALATKTNFSLLGEAVEAVKKLKEEAGGDRKKLRIPQKTSSD
jgi:hypothetical protein